MRKGLSVIAGIAVLLFVYSANAGVVTSNLVSWWKLDETNGIEAADSYEGPHYNTGTLNNFGASPTWTTDTAGTESSGALYFNASSSNYIGAGTNASLNITNAITIETWLKMSSFGDYRFYTKHGQ